LFIWNRTSFEGEANRAHMEKKQISVRGDFEPAMSSSIFAVDPVTPTNPETCSAKPVERGADIAITTRAILAVTLLGAGMWYLLWRIALYFEAAH
jgi:hypothetical protein